MTVRHSNPVSQSGFTMIPNAVMLRADLSIGAKLVYGYLKHLAWRNDSDEAVTTRDVIQRDLGIGKNQVTAYIKELTLEPTISGSKNGESPFLIEAYRQGRGLPNVYVIHDPVIPSIGESREPESGFLEDPNRAFLPSLKESKDKKELEPPSSPPFAIKVNHKQVTKGEADLSTEILAEWNRVANQSLTSTEWLSKIVMRIREQPKLTLDDHAHIIEVNLSDPWWKGSPNPSVIYGSGAQFERSIIKASSQASNGSQGAFAIAMAEMARIEEERS